MLVLHIITREIYEQLFSQFTTYAYTLWPVFHTTPPQTYIHRLRRRKTRCAHHDAVECFRSTRSRHRTSANIYTYIYNSVHMLCATAKHSSSIVKTETTKQALAFTYHASPLGREHKRIWVCMLYGFAMGIRTHTAGGVLIREEMLKENISIRFESRVFVWMHAMVVVGFYASISCLFYTLGLDYDASHITF